MMVFLLKSLFCRSIIARCCFVGVLWVYGLLCVGTIATAQAIPASPDVLSFEQFLRRVLAAHPLAESAFLEQAVAQAEIQSALGSFDPFVGARYDYKQTSARESFNRVDAAVELPLNTLFGPKVFAGFQRNIGPNVDPEVRTPLYGYMDLGISLPLWQGVLTDRRRTALEKANLRPLLANAVQQLEINALLRSATNQYWAWAESFEQLRITQAVFDISEQRLNFIATRARRGEVMALDSIEALQEIERRRGDLFRAQRAFEQSSIDLAVFLWSGSGADMRRGGARPQALTEQPVPMPAALPIIEEPQRNADRNSALTLRPEMQRIEFMQQSTTLDLNLASEFQKPFIDTKAQWLYPLQEGVSLSNFKIGVNFAMPVFFRTAGAQVELFNIALDRVALQRAQVGRLVQADVDNATNALDRARDRVRAAEREVYYATLMEEGERKRFALGETSLLIVNLRERAAAEARVRLVNAKADYMRAFGQYYWATGKIAELASLR
jgi:outer membrane protein TolC